MPVGQSERPRRDLIIITILDQSLRWTENLSADEKEKRKATPLAYRTCLLSFTWMYLAHMGLGT